MRIFYLLPLIFLLLLSLIAFKWSFPQFPIIGPLIEDNASRFILTNRIMEVLTISFIIFAAIAGCIAVLRGEK